jgi:hypothetical protein
LLNTNERHRLTEDELTLAVIDSILVSAGFSISKKHDARWRAEIKRFKTLRGEVIVHCFELESKIDDAIADLMLPVRSLRSPKWLQQRHADFHQEILGHFDLRWKIDTLHSLLQKRLPQRKDKLAELHSLLNHIKSVRNDMAHSSVRFEAVKRNERSKLLRTFLETRRGSIHVTEAFINRYKENVIEATDMLLRLMRSVRHRRKRIHVEQI